MLLYKKVSYFKGLMVSQQHVKLLQQSNALPSGNRITWFLSVYGGRLQTSLTECSKIWIRLPLEDPIRVKQAVEVLVLYFYCNCVWFLSVKRNVVFHVY